MPRRDRSQGWTLTRVSSRVVTLLCLLATVLAGCGSSGGSSGPVAATTPGKSDTSLPVVAVGCPLTAAAVSATLKTTLAQVSVSPFQQPALCAFQTASQPGMTVEISAFPFTSGRYKNWSLAKFHNDAMANARRSASGGLTTRLTEHPEWGTDAFSLLNYNSGQPIGLQLWTEKFSSVIDPGPGQLSEAAFLADAKTLGDALVAASR